MKRIMLILLACLWCSCASTKATVAGDAGNVSYASSKSEIVDWKGQSLGREVPLWVYACSDDDKAAVAKELSLSGSVFLLSQSNPGTNVDMLRAWGDQEAVVTVTESLKRQVGAATQAALKASMTDEASVEKVLDSYTVVATNAAVAGLMKCADYWTVSRSLKAGVKKAKSDDDYDYKCTYFVVYNMDTKMYQTQLRNALMESSPELADAISLSVATALEEDIR